MRLFKCAQCGGAARQREVLSDWEDVNWFPDRLCSAPCVQKFTGRLTLQGTRMRRNRTLYGLGLVEIWHGCSNWTGGPITFYCRLADYRATLGNTCG